MASVSPAGVKFEIGHVLFIDLVGYSKLLITEQIERLQKLKEIVWGTEQFRRRFCHHARQNCAIISVFTLDTHSESKLMKFA
jgi:hypothetical protein